MLYGLGLGLSFGGVLGKFSPLDVGGLFQWMDASDSSTMRLDGSNRVAVWVDKSKGLSKTNIFSSDFSSTGVGFTTVQNLTQLIDQSIAGITEANKLTFSGGVVTHNFRPPSNTIPQIRKVSFDVYVTTASGVSGVHLYSGSNLYDSTTYGNGSIPADTWTTITFNIARLTNQIRIYPTVGGGRNFDADGTDIYVKNFVEEYYDGRHWYQDAGANQPLWNGTDSITFDGSTEYLISNNYSTDYDTLNEGSIVLRGSRPLVTDRSAWFGASYNNNNYYDFILQPSGAGQIPNRNGVRSEFSAVSYIEGEDATGYTGDHTHSVVVTDGISTIFYTDGLLEVSIVDTGADTGKFLSDFANSIATVEMGRLPDVTTVYSKHSIKTLLIYDNPVSASNILKLDAVI